MLSSLSPVPSAFLCFLVLALSAAGCGDAPQREIVFAVGGSPSEVQVWEDIADDFSQQNKTRVRILRQPTDTSQRRQGLLVALSSKQQNPDVFLMDIAWFGLFAQSGWLSPLGEVDTSAFFQEILQKVNVINGDLLGLPVFLDVGILYFRDDLLKQDPPETWEDLASIAAGLQKEVRRNNPDFYGFVWQGAQYEGLVVNFLEFAGRDGGFILRDGRILVDVEQNVRALQFMYDAVHTYKISPPNTFTEMQEEEVRSFFQSKDALFERNWPYAYSLHQSEESHVRNRVGITDLPAPAGGKNASTLGGWHVGVSAFTDRPEAARKFALFLTSTPIQKKLALELGLPPSRRLLYRDSEILDKSPHYELLARVLAEAKPRPIIPAYTQVSEIMQRRLSGALAGEYSPEQALSLAQQEIDSLMTRYVREGGEQP